MKYISILFILLITACSSSQSAISKTGIEKITFGSGGGFTGASASYTLSKDGKLWVDNHEVGHLSLEKTLAIFKKSENLKNYHYQKPGNIYSFLIIHTEGDENKIIWAPKDTSIKEDVVQLFNQLNLIFKQNQK